jgi:hypothetical protein
MTARGKRWLIAAILLGIVVTFIAPRGWSWFKMRGIHEPDRSRDFLALSDAFPPAHASLTRIYRGLPHQRSDEFVRELFLSRNRSISGYRFHSKPAETTQAVLEGGPRHDSFRA